MVCAAGWALAPKETEPDAHFCAVALNTGAAKGSDDPDDGAEQENRGVGEHKENVSGDAGRQHVTCWRQAFVKVDADGNFVMPQVASLSKPEGGSEWKNGQPSGIVEVQLVAQQESVRHCQPPRTILPALAIQAPWICPWRTG